MYLSNLPSASLFNDNDDSGGDDDEDDKKNRVFNVCQYCTDIAPYANHLNVIISILYKRKLKPSKVKLFS